MPEVHISHDSENRCRATCTILEGRYVQMRSSKLLVYMFSELTVPTEALGFDHKLPFCFGYYGVY